MASVPFEIASTIRVASLNRHPSPSHDINPSTAASKKIPVEQVPHGDSLSSPPSSPSAIPVRRRRRASRPSLPPLPDLRFEQSYLASIPDGASYARIGYITVKDQVMMPLVQGLLWSLVVVGWRHWNRGASMAGQGIGAKVRRWWWGVNGWTLPEDKPRTFPKVDAGQVEEVRQWGRKTWRRLTTSVL